MDERVAIAQVTDPASFLTNRRTFNMYRGDQELAVIVVGPQHTTVRPIGWSVIHHPWPGVEALAVCDHMDRGIDRPEDAPVPRWVHVPGSPLIVNCRDCVEWRHA